jgi:hypothetical protein
MGDDRFTFNRKKNVVQIIGYKPHRRKHGVLTEDEAKYNRYLSQMCVIMRTQSQESNNGESSKECFVIGVMEKGNPM